MKNAVRCENSCELQNSLIIDLFERKWRLGDALLLEPRPSERLKTITHRVGVFARRRSARPQPSLRRPAASGQCQMEFCDVGAGETRRAGSIGNRGFVGRATCHRGVDVCARGAVQRPTPRNGRGASAGQSRSTQSRGLSSSRLAFSQAHGRPPFPAGDPILRGAPGKERPRVAAMTPITFHVSFTIPDLRSDEITRWI